jgi:hypothetical protein
MELGVSTSPPTSIRTRLIGSRVPSSGSSTASVTQQTTTKVPNWVGQPDASTQFPAEMVVDYVKVFQQPR